MRPPPPPPKKKEVILPFGIDPKILKSMVGFKTVSSFFPLFFLEKNVLKHSKLRKYQPKEGVKNKKDKISDRPTHVLVPKGQYNIFFF